MTDAEFAKSEARAKNIQDAAPLESLGTKDIIKRWRAGEFTGGQIQGWLDLHPDAAKLFIDDLNFNRDAALRRDLASEARRNNRFDLMQQLFLNTAKEAGRMHVKPGALFEAYYGFAAPDAVGGLNASYTNDDIKEAKEALQREERQERAKLLSPVLKSLDALTKHRTAGTIAAFNAAAQAADIDLRAEEQDRFGPNKTVFYWNGQEVKAEDLNTILDPNRTPSGTNEEEEPTVSPPATSSRSAANARPSNLVQSALAKYKDLPSLVQSTEYSKMSDAEKTQASQALAGTSEVHNTKFKGDIKQFDQTQFENADLGLKLMNAIVERNLTKEQVLASPRFQTLSKKDQKIVLDNLEF
jgi:hypothetical protein